jgi:ComF family protein
LKLIVHSLLSALYPQKCQVCLGPVDHLKSTVACEGCWEDTQIFSGGEMLCGRCGALLGEKAAPKPVFCRRCDEYHFDRAFAGGVYEKALSAEIIDLKHSDHLSPAIRSLVRKTIDRDSLHLSADVVIPVPLSKLRQIERGFNQAETIAREVGRLLNRPVDAMSLSRTLNTPPHRVGMDQKARELTVIKAFAVVRPNLIVGKDIVLVDDVLTSGATTSACAKALKKAGSGRVTVFTLARTVVE